MLRLSPSFRGLIVGALLAVSILAPASVAQAKTLSASAAGDLAVSTSCSYGYSSTPYVQTNQFSEHGGGVAWNSAGIEFALNCSTYYGWMSGIMSSIYGFDNCPYYWTANMLLAHHDWYLTADQGGNYTNIIGVPDCVYETEGIPNHTAYTQQGIMVYNCYNASVCGPWAWWNSVYPTGTRLKALVSGANFQVQGQSVSVSVRG